MYFSLKLLHVTFATISISLFFWRGLLTFRQSVWLRQRWLKILPHINDTLLLLSGISLAILAGYNPLHQTWLAGKIVLLVVYIVFGLIALRLARKRMTRLLFFSLAILTFSCIVSFALNKSVFFIH